MCVPDDSVYTCPGAFNTECAPGTVGDDGVFGDDDCDCDSEILFSNDCRTGYLCSRVSESWF